MYQPGASPHGIATGAKDAVAEPLPVLCCAGARSSWWVSGVVVSAQDLSYLHLACGWWNAESRLLAAGLVVRP